MRLDVFLSLFTVTSHLLFLPLCVSFLITLQLAFTLLLSMEKNLSIYVLFMLHGFNVLFADLGLMCRGTFTA